MRQIKFRGMTHAGKIIYGDLLQPVADGQTYPSIRAVFEDDGWALGCIEVNPDSVTQFVGVDKNGQEIFEGDVASFEGKDFVVTIANVDDIDICEFVRCGYETD